MNSIIKPVPKSRGTGLMANRKRGTQAFLSIKLLLNESV